MVVPGHSAASADRTAHADCFMKQGQKMKQIDAYAVAGDR